MALVVGLYYGFSERLWDAGPWWDVAFVGVVVAPLVFSLVWLALPLRRSRALLPLGAALALASWGLVGLGLDGVADFTKLAAATAVGFWCVTLFESSVFVTAIALAIPWIDAYSVWRGPTGTIVNEHPHVFTAVSFALPIPGEADAARVGPPDLLFLALFLAAAVRFGLRPGRTWLALVASLGATLAISFAVGGSGLPALPGLALGFLVPNADLLWADARRALGSRPNGTRPRTPSP